RDRQLRPLLLPRHMDPDTARRVPLRVAGLRLGADPGARAEVVVVARGERDVDGEGDLAVTVGAERGAVERLARLPGQPAAVVRRPHELLHLDDDVVARAQAGAAHSDRDGLAGFRRQRDARLGAIAPRLHARVDAEEQAEHDEAEARIDGDPSSGEPSRSAKAATDPAKMASTASPKAPYVASGWSRAMWPTRPPVIASPVRTAPSAGIAASKNPAAPLTPFPTGRNLDMAAPFR